MSGIAIDASLEARMTRLEIGLWSLLAATARLNRVMVGQGSTDAASHQAVMRLLGDCERELGLARALMQAKAEAAGVQRKV